MARIAFLSAYSQISNRGAETFVYELSKRFRARHQITIFQGGEKIANPRIRTYHVKAAIKPPTANTGLLPKLYLDWQSLKILVFTLKSIPKILAGKFDVIIPINGGWQTLVIRILSKFTGSSVLICAHAGIGADDALNIFLRPDVFVALTAAQFKWAKELSTEIQIVLIPHGVDLALFNPKVKGRSIALKKPIVVCTAALVPYKRIDLSIKAVAKTKHLSFLLLGEGQLASYLDALGKRLLGKRYLRLNPDYTQMQFYYRAADIFTLPSKTEAFGIAYLEAMACNLPVVATCDSSRQEIIGEAGILTDPEKIDKYAKDLEIALKTNYHNIPYNQALKFSWNRIAKEYSLLIKNLKKNG